MLRCVLFRNKYLYKLLKHSSQTNSISKFLNQIVAKQYCTSSIVTFDTPAVQKYLNYLMAEYKTLQVESESYESSKKIRLQEIQPVINILEERNTLHDNIKTLKELIISDDSKDENFRSTVVAEQQTYLERIKELESMLLTVLVPPEAEDECSNVIMEVSAGVGGQEAMLFARELFDMYCNYITYKRWQMEIAQQDLSELGGLRHASILISGDEVYQYLKYEAGVHRVQRVPSTEKSGRVHTSTVSVAVLAQPEEIDIVLQDKDLRVETKRASGAGGQHVNKTESAVRITHIPTGISVECQVDRSQIKNREIAMRSLKTRIYHRQLEDQISKTQATRKQQVGSSMRSEKIRTYNFNQDRITDHRLGSNFYSMDIFLAGGELLDKLVNQLHDKRSKERLIQLLDSVQT